MLHSTSAQLIYLAAIKQGLDAQIESTRFNLFSIQINGEKVFIKGTNVPLNSQSSSVIASNKYLSKKIFKQNDILTPKSWLFPSISKTRKFIVNNNIFPCVIKPIFGAHGNEVYANIESTQELDAVLHFFSKKDHKNILVEEYIEGTDYRILVVGNKVSAVIERTPAHVVGDGRHTIRELINKFNMNPLVGKKFEKPMCRIRLDFELSRTLKKNSLNLNSVIKRNARVFLKQNANISAGGTSSNATEELNKNSRAIAIKAAHSIGMKFCGVDVIYNEKTQKSYVLEVNDCPGIDIHHFPLNGDPQDVAGDLIKELISSNTEEQLHQERVKSLNFLSGATFNQKN